MSENATTLPDISCPRQLFGKDLHSDIRKKLDLGHNLIVQGDLNFHHEDLLFWMLELGLEDIIAKKNLLGPTTYNRSADAPIDHIFGTFNFNIKHGGFLAYRRLLSDHLGLCVDIPNHMLFG